MGQCPHSHLWQWLLRSKQGDAPVPAPEYLGQGTVERE
ncbi:hypothetical protein AVDCRST_MAG92-4354 [uncultured Coleofasciculus sp.]|uniref:Uncharacterized protein n=1 Tax=uncultured Coleofasciculus sp. TaxID=1267456 RepID=A0A6J4K0L1_9CYAN|nr:hypothetical protein AVDCRST_MAG92-4354 [uncultured Coleofasciculus sp.]